MRLLQSRMQLMKAELLGPAFPKESGFTRTHDLPKELEAYIARWKKSRIAAAKVAKKAPTKIRPSDLTHAPEFQEDGKIVYLESREALKRALSSTALEWSEQVPKNQNSNERNVRIILAGCCIQLDTVWCSRRSWLAEETIVSFREEFRKLICGIPNMQKWEFWDGMLEIAVEKKRDPVTGNVIEEEVDMSGIDLVGRSDGEVSKIRRQVATAAKAKDASKALTEADLAASQMDVAKRIWRLIQAPGVGTVNLGTETDPIWEMTPQIKLTFEQAMQVRAVNSGLH